MIRISYVFDYLLCCVWYVKFHFLCQAIAKDDVLSKCKIIAEPWDCGGLYLVGKFPNWDR